MIAIVSLSQQVAAVENAEKKSTRGTQQNGQNGKLGVTFSQDPSE